MPEQVPRRRLAAIFAADVVGYSRLMQVDEAGTLAVLKSRRSEILQPVVSKHRGRVVKLMGDGVLIEFASAVDAVECAVHLQAAMENANAGLPEDRRIVLRVGINLGDVIVEGGDLYGDGVNIAARVEALAEPGTIFVTGSVYDQIKGKAAVASDDMGLRTLKNIAGPIQIYRIRSTSSAGVGVGAAAGETLALPAKPSVAVLPFVNMSGDPEQRYFSDGITEDIITELSRFQSLFVIARNSSFRYRDQAIDVRQVARDLGVRYVVEGSVRKMAARVRITVQLIDALSGNHLWSERYDRGLSELFEVQDDVARTIVSTLAGRIEDSELSGTARSRTDNLPAYECLLRGIEHLRGYAADDNRLARELFERAVQLDPQYALAHAYLGLSLLVENGYAGASQAIKDQSLEEALTALRLNSHDSRSHLFLGMIYGYRSEFERAKQHYDRATELNPNDANCLTATGFNSALLGHPEEGTELIREAMRLNPFHPPWYWEDLAIVLYAARRYEEAIEANLRISAKPRPWTLARLAACCAQLGRMKEARAYAAEALRLKPDLCLSSADLPYKNSADADHVFEGMRKAGVPE
jgi:TolB-like protein/Flp pilus assembly protein TadD